MNRGVCVCVGGIGTGLWLSLGAKYLGGQRDEDGRS